MGINLRKVVGHLQKTAAVRCKGYVFMQLGLKHSLGFMSAVAVYVPTEVCETEEKEIICAKLESLPNQCPGHDELIILSD